MSDCDILAAQNHDLKQRNKHAKYVLSAAFACKTLGFERDPRENIEEKEHRHELKESNHEPTLELLDAATTIFATYGVRDQRWNVERHVSYLWKWC